MGGGGGNFVPYRYKCSLKELVVLVWNMYMIWMLPSLVWFSCVVNSVAFDHKQLLRQDCETKPPSLKLKNGLFKLTNYMTFSPLYNLLTLSYSLQFLLLSFCTEKLWTPLTSNSLFYHRKIHFAHPDWIEFYSDFDSSSNGKNSKLKLDIRCRLFDALVYMSICISKNIFTVFFQIKD